MIRRRVVMLAKALLARVIEGPPLFLFVALSVGIGVAGAAKAYVASQSDPIVEHATAVDAGRPAPRVVASSESAKEKETAERLLHRQHGTTVPRRAAPRRGAATTR